MAIASSQRLQNFHSASREVTMLLPGVARDVSEFFRDGLFPDMVLRGWKQHTAIEFGRLRDCLLGSDSPG